MRSCAPAVTAAGGRAAAARPSRVRSRALAPMLLCWAISAPALAAESGSHRHAAPTVLAPGYSTLEFEPPPAGSYALPPLGPAADGTVLDARGRAHRLHDLLGDRLVVMSFIFTRCSDVNGCPLASYVLNRLQQKLRDDGDLARQVRLISLSFDPDHDTPAVLADYGARFHTAAVDWRFLTTASRDALQPILEG